MGVEYMKEVDDRKWSGVQPTSIVRASRLVVISAGAFGSPTILERSGIGAKEILEKNGIPPLVDLPGVGDNYMGMRSWIQPAFSETHGDADHIATTPYYRASDDAESMDHIFRGTASLEGSNLCPIDF